jgi:hypothetical protein
MAAVVSLEPAYLEPRYLEPRYFEPELRPARPALRLVPGVPALPEPYRPVSYRRPRPQVARSHRPAAAAMYRRRRVLAALLGLGLLLAGARVGSAFGGTLAATERLPHVQHVVVEPGDSLWSIAQRVAPGHDPRPIVDAIAHARGTAAVQPGETLTVPAP